MEQFVCRLTTRDTIQCIQAATQNNIVYSVETTVHCDSLSMERLISTRVAPYLIFFQIRSGPDLAGFGIANPAGPGPGLEPNVLELEA